MFDPRKTVLVVIDVQGKLASLVHQKDQLFPNIQRLIKAANLLDVPIISTEQLPEKIGPTVEEIARCLHGAEHSVKSTFSCCGQPDFLKKIHSRGRTQIIIAGIETHVCVYQTCVHLLEEDLEVAVVCDAVSSRTLENKLIALDRMKTLGAYLTSTEMMVCELLGGAGHPKFKEVLNLIK